MGRLSGRLRWLSQNKNLRGIVLHGLKECLLERRGEGCNGSSQAFEYGCRVKRCVSIAKNYDVMVATRWEVEWSRSKGLWEAYKQMLTRRKRCCGRLG